MYMYIYAYVVYRSLSVPRGGNVTGGGRGIAIYCIIVDRCCTSYVLPLFLCLNTQHAYVFVKSVFMCLHECKSCFGLSTYTFSFSLSSLQACSRWSVKASTAFLLIEDASRPLWCPAGTAEADRRQRQGDRGRHRTYNNSSGNKFEKWGTRSPFAITPSLTLTMLRRGWLCVSG